MSDARAHTGVARANAVADLPIDAALARADELARRWASALVIASPLERLGEIPLEDLAHEGPTLVAGLLRALVSDAGLEQLLAGAAGAAAEQPAPAARLGAIAGARDAAAAVRAVEALRGVLWEALLEEMPTPSSRQLGEVADRLAYVCASASARTIATAHGGARGHAGRRERPAAPKILIVDERREAAAELTRTRPASAALDTGRASRRDRPLQPSLAPPFPEIEIRDQRRHEGTAAWVDAIERALEGFNRDGVPFAVLLVELPDIVRLGAGEVPARLADQLEGVLEAELRRLAPQGGAPGESRRAAWRSSLTRESPGRYWLLARTDRAGARRIAERLTYAAAAGRREQQLELAVGTAGCPEDGRDAPALAAHADVDLYAARASKAPRGGWVDERA